MTARLVLLLPLLAMMPVSCDKARDFARRAKAAAEERLGGSGAGEAGGVPDPALRELVQESPEGYVFRKDLPFPSSIQVAVTERIHFKRARSFQNTALGADSTSLDGKTQVVTTISRAGDTVRVSIETVGRSATDPANPEKEIIEKVSDGFGGTSAEFRRRPDGGWKALPTMDFKAAVWSRELAPLLSSLLTENGIMPRSQWFGQRRIQIGDSIPITGPALALLFGEGATGAVTLKFDSTGACDGHPCGIFSIVGDYRRKNTVAIDGTIADEDVTIESGKIWLSLLYPLILRQEFETVQTRVKDSGGGASSRVQGSMAVSTVRSWGPVGK